MELLTLTATELERIRVAQQVLDRAMSVADAASELHISGRQVKRLTRRLRTHGPAALASRRRGIAPNNAVDPLVRQHVIELATSAYRGFGPTFLAEKLAERDGIDINRETLRQWLIEGGLHRARHRRSKPRPLRERRPRFGELIQADGSPHRWFEDRGDACSLLLCIDDATSFVLGGLFAPAETTDGYFELFENAFARYGIPLACYTDRHSIFRMNQAGTRIGEETQVQRALGELDVQLICANSPQAKGRVERLNRTLQDRLVKELRLAGVATIPHANTVLPTLLDDHNARFAVDPKDADNANRSSEGIPLRAILSRCYDRMLTSNLTFQLRDRVYAIDPPDQHRLRVGVRVNVHVPRGGEPVVMHRNQLLPVRLVGDRQRAGTIVTSKDLNTTVDARVQAKSKAHTPSQSHPWRTGYDPALLAAARERQGTSLNC